MIRCDDIGMIFFREFVFKMHILFGRYTSLATFVAWRTWEAPARKPNLGYMGSDGMFILGGSLQAWKIFHMSSAVDQNSLFPAMFADQLRFERLKHLG